MIIKKNGNNINIYDGKKLVLHLDRRGDVFRAITDHVRISAKIEKVNNTETKFFDVSLKKMNSSGKIVKNTSRKWMQYYTAWLENVCCKYGLL